MDTKLETQIITIERDIVKICPKNASAAQILKDILNEYAST